MTRWHDDPYQETHVIDSVRVCEDSIIATSDGWSIIVGNVNEVPFFPRIGMEITLISSGSRGVYIDGVAFREYRTEEEHREEVLRRSYGKDAREWVERWDSGKSVHSVVMGGFGPGYEQALQIAAVESVRWLLENPGEESSQLRSLRAYLDAPGGVSEQLGLSGHQVGAAISLGNLIYHNGPVSTLSAFSGSDRSIMISKHFPKYTRAGENVRNEDT